MKTYIFGIGGTGGRVIKSLTMLMAAGVRMNTDIIVPILIDPDDGAADLTRTVQLLRNYQKVHDKLDFNASNQNQFFKTDIQELIPSYRLKLANTQNAKFKDYIELNSLDLGNKALFEMLFSQDNLDSDMEVGFKGNPNIGSVVLNQFTQSTEFKNFASSFVQGDRLFIISSIFGGTGASGFPLLLKNLRSLDRSFPNADLIRNAAVGAITVLPYFGVKTDEASKIDKSTFISKTKSALSYYERNVSGNHSLNALYYLGDTVSKDYENHEGGSLQKNEAHFIELAAALAVIDFMNIEDDVLQTTHGVASNPIYKEFGIKHDTSSIIFEDLSDGGRELLQKPLTQFVLFCKYMNEQLKSSQYQDWAKGKTKFNETFTSSPFYGSYLKEIKVSFLTWLEEMANNNRRFTPFELSEKKELFELVRGVKPERVISLKSNYDLFNDRLCSIESKLKNDSSTEQRFMELFYNTTEKLIFEKLKL